MFKVFDGSHILEEDRNEGDLFTGNDGLEVLSIFNQQITFFLLIAIIQPYPKNRKTFLISKRQITFINQH